MDWDGNEITLFNSESETQDKIPRRIVAVLEEFQDVFQEPTGLPPVRGFEHTIRLWEGTKPIAGRPYRYPHVHMTTIELMVK